MLAKQDKVIRYSRVSSIIHVTNSILFLRLTVCHLLHVIMTTRVRQPADV